MDDLYTLLCKLIANHFDVNMASDESEFSDLDDGELDYILKYGSDSDRSDISLSSDEFSDDDIPLADLIRRREDGLRADDDAEGRVCLFDFSIIYK